MKHSISKCTNAAVPKPVASDALPIQVAFKEPNKIATQGEPLPVEIVATGGKSIESVKLFYRPLGEGEFVSTPMTRGFGNVYQAAIPGSAVTEKGLEYYIEVRGVKDQLFRVPKRTSFHRRDRHKARMIPTPERACRLRTAVR